MKKIYYEKVGRKYKPVYEYDSNLLDSFPKGNHLISVYPGGQSTRYNVDPNYAAMIAAGRIAEDAICQAMLKASELRPAMQPITAEQRDLWERLSKSFELDDIRLHRASVADSVRAGTEAMVKEANRIMQHEAVRQAFEHFLTVAKLCSDYQESK